ncbi:metallophosphoesterase [Nakamurella sp. GG22]
MRSVPGWIWPNITMLALVGGYVWWRLVKGTTRPRTTARRAWTVVIVAVTALGPLALIAQYALPIAAQRVLIGPIGWTCYGLLIFLATATVLTEPVRIWWWWQRCRPQRATVSESEATHAGSPQTTPHMGTQSAPAANEPAAHEPAPQTHSTTTVTTAPPDPDRRLFLQRALAVGIGAVATITTGIAARSALGGPAVRTATIALPNIPAEAVGMRVALISDLHLGSVLGADFCRSVVELVNAQQPDVICLIGDLSDGSVAELGEELRPLADLRAPEGVFVVTGNHEFYFDPDGWIAFLPQLGMRLLANEGEPVRGLLLAGVHDIAGRPTGRGPDMDAALTTRAPDQPVIMMSHSPNLVDDAADRQVDLMVSGHTHGGQFFPGTLAVAATSKAVSGYYSFGPTQLFITNGAGFWGPIARLGAPPDITMLTLVAPGTSAPAAS